MTTVLEAMMSAPSGDRWLEAHNDPLANIYTFSSCVALSDLRCRHLSIELTMINYNYLHLSATIYYLHLSIELIMIIYNHPLLSTIYSGDGDYRLVVADLGTGDYNMKLRWPLLGV